IRSAHLDRSKGPINAHTFDSGEFEVEYFVASDAAAIVEHTKQVLFLEDDDVAFVEDGALSIHRITRKMSSEDTQQTREVQSLNLELQQIMKGNFKTFMQKVCI
ncbi:hypothetical protein OESDEN_18613, partial [Oesophagostomum dentatum]